MVRRVLLACAGTLALFALGSGVGYHAVRVGPRKVASHAPRPLPEAASARARPARQLSRPPVVRTGLIEAAIPPSPRTNEPVPPTPAPTPIAIKVPWDRRAPKPVTIEVRPTKALPKQPASPPAMPAAKKPTASKTEPQFIVRSITSSLPRSLAPSKAAGNLVTKRKTQFVTPKITPASPATVPPTLPLFVPAREEPKTSQVLPDSKRHIKAVPERAKSMREPSVARKQPMPAPADAQPVPAREKPTADKLAPAPVEVAPTPSVAKRTPARKKLAAKKRAPVRVKTAPAQAVAKPAAGSNARATDKPAPVPVKVAPKPATDAPPVAAEKLAADKLSPTGVEVAPVPAIKKPVGAAESVADVDSGRAPLKKQEAVSGLRVERKVADGDAPANVAESHASSRLRPAAPSAIPLAEDSRAKSSVAPQYTRLPWNQPTARSPQLTAALKRADKRVLHGYELASRGALYSARAEFTAALKMIAQARDTQQGRRHHTKAAAAGLTALKEAGDFARHSRSLRDIDLSTVILPHSTPVLKDGDTSDVTPTTAAQLYYSYAQEQLAAAVAQEICGSMALYAMGKVETMVAKSGGPTLESTGRATALYRASLITYPKNFRAANELGVLLGENGQYELARDLLIRSVSVSPQATTWRNLSTMHARLGERDLAERAQRQALAMRPQGRDASTAPPVKWVDTATFASTTPATDSLPVSVAPALQNPAAANPAGAKSAKKPPVNVAKRTIGDWIRLGPRR